MEPLSEREKYAYLKLIERYLQDHREPDWMEMICDLRMWEPLDVGESMDVLLGKKEYRVERVK